MLPTSTHTFKYALLFLKCNLNVMQLKIRCSGGRGKLYGHTKDIFAFVSSRFHKANQWVTRGDHQGEYPSKHMKIG